MMTLVFETVLPWLLVVVGGWLLLQLVRQNGRILLRLESIERRLLPPPGSPGRTPAQGLPLGSPAPEFELPDLSGARHKLSAWRGRDILLIFFNPGCGFCTRMAADLAAVPFDGAGGRPLPVVVTTGELAANRKLVEQYGIKCVVLLQNEREVAEQYRAQGTPMGYRIDAAGRISSELTIGAEQLLQLASGQSPERLASRTSGKNSTHRTKQPDPSLSRSRINRDGLKAGTSAPEFTLPRIDGGELALQDCRGRRVLLVFSDPECGPCDELAPHLQELHAAGTGLQVLVISRKDADATREKAARLGLTFPIVMQKQWELSMKYGMFATPIGYLIDEQGVLLSDVAIGVEPILALAKPSRLTAAADGNPARSHEEYAMAAS
ncbi:MAG: redoxin domain-containing protein [Planctomycetaceae bacterium]